MSSDVSTLSEITNVLGSYVYWILSKIQPDRWKSESQVFYSFTEDWESNFYWFQRHNNTSAISYPFAAITRVPEILSIDSGNGLRPWDIDWYTRYNSSNYEEGTTPKTVKTVRVRRVALGYYLNIWDGSWIKSEKTIDRIIMQGMRGPKRVDYNSIPLTIPSRITIEMAIPRRIRVPSVKDSTDGSGNIFGVSIPLAVTGLVGTVYNKPYILTNNLNIGEESTNNNPENIVSDDPEDDNFYIVISKLTQHYDGSLTVNP